MRYAFALMLACVCAASGRADTPGFTPGFTTERPSQGRFVEVEGGYLTPYEARIPGTDVTFWMEPIPGGPVELPAPEGAEPTTVELAPYWIGRTEVTWGEYRQYMNLCAVFRQFDQKGVRRVTDENRPDAVTAPSQPYDLQFIFDAGDHPMLPAVSMTRYAAKQYTKWLSLLTRDFYRIPSEAEWVCACRATSESVHATDRKSVV